MTTNAQGYQQGRVLLDDYVSIGQFNLDEVTVGNYGLINHYSRMNFILREEMATLNPFYEANAPMGDDGYPQGIIVHSTASANTRLNVFVGPSDDALNDTNREARTAILGVNRHNNCWNRSTHTRAAVHAWIGTTRAGNIATYQTLPWNIRGRHAGPANATHIGFEICEFNRADNPMNRAYLNAAYKEAVQLCAYLCRMFGFDPMNEMQLIDHWGGSNLTPPLTNPSADVDEPISSAGSRNSAGYFYIFDRNMGQFRTDVLAVMNA
jgi:hypothetical protein